MTTFTSWRTPGLAAMLAVALVAAHHEGPHPAAAMARAGQAETPPVSSPSRSCKPVPPVAIELTPGATAGSWRVHLVALQSSTRITVTLGTRKDDAELSRLTPWVGAFASGEERTLEVQMDVPLGATEIRAEAAAPAAPGSVLCSRVRLPLDASGAVTPITAAVEDGRTVTAADGESVVEFVATPGGVR
jgi:hypothetical protein